MNDGKLGSNHNCSDYCLSYLNNMEQGNGAKDVGDCCGNKRDSQKRRKSFLCIYRICPPRRIYSNSVI